MPAETEHNRPLRLGDVTIIILLLWMAYTAIYTLAPGGVLSAGLDLIPGIAGILVLTKGAGFRLQECYLKPARISLQGLVLLLSFLLALIPILLPGRWVGWDWRAGLLYAPASGIAQELFFRASLLPVTMRLFKNNRLHGVLAHSVLFVAWHMPIALMKAPPAGAIGIAIVTFIGGMIWGWQVQRDKTIYWAMGQHIIYLVLMSLFIWE